MSIHADLLSALSSVAGGRVFMWGEVTEDTALPLVVVRRTSHEPIALLSGPSGWAMSNFSFECWGEKGASMGAKAQALSVASDVRAAINASSLIHGDLPVSGEDYDEATLEEMEPVAFRFQHQE